MEKPQASFQCDECRRLFRALRVAWRTDTRAVRAKMHDVAASSGRDLRQFGVSWVFSIAEMPNAEMRYVLDSHYPHVAEARREGEEHEAASGHSLKGWWPILNQ
jgi:hypothetical protein